MKKLSLAYFGSPDFSARFLEKIFEDRDLPIFVKLVVTQEDKPVGRKQTKTPSPVKVVAKQYKVNVLEKLPDAKLLSSIDLALLFAYGKIIHKKLLNAPKYGFWNIHPSLLPKYRGPSPVAYPLITAEKETGATLMQMDEQVDHGPIIAHEKMQIFPKEKRDQLTKRLSDLAYAIFKEQIEKLKRTEVKVTAQNHSKATYTKLMEKKDGFISIKNLKFKIKNSPHKLFNLYRGLYPWPGIWTKVKVKGKNQRLKITDMDFDGRKVIIKKLQLEGKNEVSIKQFNEAYRIF